MHRMQLLSEPISFAALSVEQMPKSSTIGSAQFAEIQEFNLEGLPHGIGVGVDCLVSDMTKDQLNIAFL